MSEKRYSNCCGALPYGELDSYTEDGHTYHIGRCSNCKDGAEFLTQKQLDAEICDLISDDDEDDKMFKGKSFEREDK